MGTAVLFFLGWADDFTVVASGIMELQIMLSELASTLFAHGIRLKQTKSHWIANQHAWAALGRSSFDLVATVSANLGMQLAEERGEDEHYTSLVRPEDERDQDAYEQELCHDWSADGVPTIVVHDELPGPAEGCCAVRFSLASELVVLGACLSADADAPTAVEFALSRARHQWIRRRKQLCRMRVPLSKRIARYHATVCLTALHGLEGIPLSQTVLGQLQSFDRRCLRAMLGMRKRDEEGWVAFRSRQNRLLRRVFRKMGRTELAAQLLSKYHGWAGHVTRLGRHHLAAQWATTNTVEDWHLSQAIHQEDVKNSTGWRHGGAGRIVRWEGMLVKVYGDLWRQRAADRRAWRSDRSTFIFEACNLLLGTGHGVFGTSAEDVRERGSPPATACSRAIAAPASTQETGWAFAMDWMLTRPRATSLLAHLRQGIAMQFIGDSKVLLDCLLGHAQAHTEVLRRPVSHAHWTLTRLVSDFLVRPPQGRDIAQHVMRSDNGAADAAANQALDSESFRRVNGQETLRFLEWAATSGVEEDVGLLFSFDGASRGNPGEASFGICAWWGVWSGEEFVERGWLLQRGVRLGTCTNNAAEAEGMAAALRAALIWHFEVAEALARQAGKDERTLGYSWGSTPDELTA